MQKIIKVGLIGCGHIAETYFRAHKYFNNFKIIKCADINKKLQKNVLRPIRLIFVLLMKYSKIKILR